MNNYYDEHAMEFFKGTVNADMSSHYTHFLKYLPVNASILDAGCGQARDAKHFKDSGYDVTAIDGSAEMCRIAGEYLGDEVLHMQFQEMAFDGEFDGIWAMASLLHVPSGEIVDVLKRFKKAFKVNGILYASFKYGDYEGFRNGRYFNDFTEETAVDVFEKIGFNVIEIWISKDARENRENEKWVNILVKKDYV